MITSIHRIALIDGYVVAIILSGVAKKKTALLYISSWDYQSFYFLTLFVMNREAEIKKQAVAIPDINIKPWVIFSVPLECCFLSALLGFRVLIAFLLRDEQKGPSSMSAIFILRICFSCSTTSWPHAPAISAPIVRLRGKPKRVGMQNVRMDFQASSVGKYTKKATCLIEQNDPYELTMRRNSCICSSLGQLNLSFTSVLL